MKRWKKIALALVLLFVVTQTPFIYRRFRFGRLQQQIDALNASRLMPEADGYDDHAGVMHVHSLLGGHSTGRLEEIVAAAKQNRLAFVVMTEHPARYTNTAETTLRGTHEGILFVGGNEINTTGEDRLLVLPGLAPDMPAALPVGSTGEFISTAREHGRLVFVAYPEQLANWDLPAYDGIEVYNLFTNSKRASYALLFFDGLWSYRSYPHLLFTDFFERPAEQLRRWDEVTARGGRRVVAVAGNDAHQNVGLSLQDQTGAGFLSIQLDPYERSFRVVRTHALVERGRALDTQALLSALAAGHTYIAFDLFCDATGFRFTAQSSGERKLMGDEIALAPDLTLRVRLPVKARVVYFRDGQAVHEERETEESVWPVTERGVYRVEVYLEQLGAPLNREAWIISNPIYVR